MSADLGVVRLLCVVSLKPTMRVAVSLSLSSSHSLLLLLSLTTARGQLYQAAKIPGETRRLCHILVRTIYRRVKSPLQ